MRIASESPIKRIFNTASRPIRVSTVPTTTLRSEGQNALGRRVRLRNHGDAGDWMDLVPAVLHVLHVDTHDSHTLTLHVWSKNCLPEAIADTLLNSVGLGWLLRTAWLDD